MAFIASYCGEQKLSYWHTVCFQMLHSDSKLITTNQLCVIFIHRHSNYDNRSSKTNSIIFQYNDKLSCSKQHTKNQVCICFLAEVIVFQCEIYWCSYFVLTTHKSVSIFCLRDLPMQRKCIIFHVAINWNQLQTQKLPSLHVSMFWPTSLLYFVWNVA